MGLMGIPGAIGALLTGECKVTGKSPPARPQVGLEPCFRLTKVRW